MHLVSQSRPQVQRDKLLRLPEVEKITGLQKTTIYRLMKEGTFPKRVQVSSRCVAWPESRVLQFVQDRIAQADKTGGDLLSGGQGAAPGAVGAVQGEAAGGAE